MSRCPHEQSDYQLKKLPRCSKCKEELVLVMASYELQKNCVMEWECPKCHKIIAQSLLQETPGNNDSFERMLNERQKRDSRRISAYNKQKSNNKKRYH